jgi:hypothetical protein
MTLAQGVGVLLIVLGLIYALLYVGWLRRSHKNASAASAASAAGAAEPGAAEPGPHQMAGHRRTKAAGPPRALTLAWVEGTYLRTTTADTRLGRVAAEGLGVKARATMVVDENSVRWEREGLADVRVAGDQLIGVSLERGKAGKLTGRASIVLVTWHADDGESGDRFATGFLPRSRADSAVLVSAVQRLKKIGPQSQAESQRTQAQRTQSQRTESQRTQDGTP